MNAKFLMKKQKKYAIPLNTCSYCGFVGTCMLTMACKFSRFYNLASP